MPSDFLQGVQDRVGVRRNNSVYSALVVLWLLVLQRLEVGIAYPMLSLNFVLITLIARFVFREPIDRQHWIGVALVIGGVALLGQQS